MIRIEGEENTVSVFNTLNDDSISPSARDIVFHGEIGVNFVFSKMDGDDIYVQPTTLEGLPDPIFPPIKANKYKLRASGFTVKNSSDDSAQ